MAHWHALWALLMNLREQVVEQVAALKLVSSEDQFENSHEFFLSVGQLVSKLLEIISISIHLGVGFGGVQLLSEEVLVDTAVPEELWALEHSHLAAADSVQVGHFINVWHSSRKKLVGHLVNSGSVLVNWHARAVDLAAAWFEFKHSDERDLLVQLESIDILIVQLHNGRLCSRLRLVGGSSLFENLINPIV